MDHAFQREIAQQILNRGATVNDVWKLACSLQINVILQAYDADQLAEKREDLHWDLSVIDKLLQSANPHVTVQLFAHLIGPQLTPVPTTGE